MTTILLIALTWYATKVYYTRDFIIHIPKKDPNMGYISCVKCNKTSYTNRQNFRNPYYCSYCK